MQVLTEAFTQKIAKLNGVIRLLRQAGITVQAVDYDKGGRLQLASEPPVDVVPHLMFKKNGINLAQYDGVTLAWH
ncbi:hypothetical protein [Iodobacter sp.]|uniref:hypothetical protein n=1 Tax=Iodobacter sp. TaxID=1915058 RepID=UPI0025FA5DC3|nr:hypothetical protein [Iodobacter sp.]